MRGAVALLTCLLAFLGAPASAAKFQIEASALEKLLKAEVFRDDGKWRLGKAGACNDPYLEYPSVSVRQGRIFLKARFAGRIGTELFGACVSGGDPSWVTVSGQPKIVGLTLSLVDVRVEEVEKSSIRALARRLLEGPAASTLKLDLQKALAVLTAPSNTVPYLVDLSGLSVTLDQVDQDRLRLTLDFGVSIR